MAQEQKKIMDIGAVLMTVVRDVPRYENSEEAAFRVHGHQELGL